MITKYTTVACIALTVVPLAGAASAAPDSGKAIAQRAYAEGKRLYDVGEYAKALAEFKRAYLNYEEPSFLFNMAQCHRALGDKPEAIRAYRSYLRNSPDAANAADVRRIVAELEAAVAQERSAAEASARAAAGPPPGTLSPPTHEPARTVAAPTSAPAVTLTAAPAAPPKRGRRTWWVWPVVGVVVAGVAVGVAVGVTQSRSTESSLNAVHFP